MKLTCSLLVVSNLLGANAWVPFSFKRNNVVSFATVPNKDIDPSTGKNVQKQPKIGLNPDVEIEAKAELRVEPIVEKLAEENVERETEAKINAQYHNGIAPEVVTEAVTAPLSAPKKAKKVLTPEQIHELERAAELKVEAAMEAKVEKPAEQAVEKLMERSVEVELSMTVEQSTPQQRIGVETNVENQLQSQKTQTQATITPAVVDQTTQVVTEPVPPATTVEAVDVPPAASVKTITPEKREQAAENMLKKKDAETMLNALAEKAVEVKIEDAVEKSAEAAAEKIVSETYGDIGENEKALDMETRLKEMSSLMDKNMAELIPELSLADRGVVEKKVEADVEEISEKIAVAKVVKEAEEKIMTELRTVEVDNSKKAYLALENSSSKKPISEVASVTEGGSNEEQHALQRAAELIARELPLTSDSLSEKYADIKSMEERAFQILVDLNMVIVHPDPDSPDYDHSTDDEIVPQGVWV